MSSPILFFNNKALSISSSFFCLFIFPSQIKVLFRHSHLFNFAFRCPCMSLLQAFVFCRVNEYLINCQSLSEAYIPPSCVWLTFDNLGSNNGPHWDMDQFVPPDPGNYLFVILLEKKREKFIKEYLGKFDKRK